MDKKPITKAWVDEDEDGGWDRNSDCDHGEDNSSNYPTDEDS
jgi:hypothetical protein